MQSRGARGAVRTSKKCSWFGAFKEIFTTDLATNLLPERLVKGILSTEQDVGKLTMRTRGHEPVRSQR